MMRNKLQGKHNHQSQSPKRRSSRGGEAQHDKPFKCGDEKQVSRKIANDKVPHQRSWKITQRLVGHTKCVHGYWRLFLCSMSTKVCSQFTVMWQTRSITAEVMTTTKLRSYRFFLKQNQSANFPGQIIWTWRGTTKVTFLELFGHKGLGRAIYSMWHGVDIGLTAEWWLQHY